MHIVVVGCGRVGSELAASLEGDGHSVAVVDKRSTSFARLPAGFGGRTIEGYGFDRATFHSHEVHAGVGISREYPLFLYTKKARTLYNYLGDPRHHRELLAQALDL